MIQIEQKQKIQKSQKGESSTLKSCREVPSSKRIKRCKYGIHHTYSIARFIATRRRRPENKISKKILRNE